MELASCSLIFRSCGVRDMRRYAIYDLKTGHVVKTHSEVDLGGRHQELGDDEVLSTLDPKVDRASVGVVAIDVEPLSGVSGTNRYIDPKTRKLVAKLS
jgi:hypothetical protein